MMKTLVIGLGASFACTLAATADVTFDYNGVNYTVGTVTGTFNQYKNLIESQPWYNSYTLEYYLRTEAADLAPLGFFNQPEYYLPDSETNLASPIWAGLAVNAPGTDYTFAVEGTDFVAYNSTSLIGQAPAPWQVATYAVVVTPEPASYVMAAGVSLAMIGLCRWSAGKKA